MLVRRQDSEAERHEQGSEACIVVAALTHRRPDGLAKLLSHCANLAMPDNVHVVVLIVDNDFNESAREVVARYDSAIADIRYVCEARRGIPVARNRALDEALALGADALCFIDDDEYPESNWLVNLVDCWRDTGAHLIGGPVEVSGMSGGTGTWSKFVNESLIGRMHRKNRKTAWAAETGRPYTVVTNNWLCDLGWQRQSGVRFDESFLVSGGSDTAFFRDATLAGGKTAWCPSATVYETMPRSRLTLAYQFRRAIAQSITNFRIKNAEVSWTIVLRTLVVALVRFVLGALLLLVPVFGVASPVVATRSLGWAVGRIKALIGGKSELYKWSEADPVLPADARRFATGTGTSFEE